MTWMQHAIRATLEHIDSYCAHAFFPYRMIAEKALEFGEPFAQQAEPTVFTHGRPDRSS